mmetsp:Transcript_11518/g.15932  ORF Transcript_11518/g.15932 Transcript_11518/m.15932 type:complete len:184 (-) Transcript_11518:311-862(-)
MQKVDPPIPGMESLNLGFISSMLGVFSSALSEGKEGGRSGRRRSGGDGLGLADGANDEPARETSAKIELKQPDQKGEKASGAQQAKRLSAAHPPPPVSAPVLEGAAASPANPSEEGVLGGGEDGAVPPPPKPAKAKRNKGNDEGEKEKKEKSDRQRRRAAHALRTLNMITLQRVVLMAPSSSS